MANSLAFDSLMTILQLSEFRNSHCDLTRKNTYQNQIHKDF